MRANRPRDAEARNAEASKALGAPKELLRRRVVGLLQRRRWQSRDSDCLEQSNFAVMLAALGGETEKVVVVRESHWAVGWVEWIAIHEADTAALKIADGQCERLTNYPILDEDDFGEREFEAQCETWANAGLQGRMEYCRRAGISIFAARREELPEDDNGRLGELLLGD